jgi:hypothetical protein
MQIHYRPGDLVVFVVSKISRDPGPRAHDIHPAPFGETYQYIVDKYWTVRAISGDGALELVTRRGKVHHVRANDPRLRPARLWERWFQRERFPDLAQLASSAKLPPAVEPEPLAVSRH